MFLGFTNASIQHTLREAKSIVHLLAKEALKLQEDIVNLEVVYECILLKVFKDMM